METSLIEQLDKSRYSLIKWLTIGWALFFGGYIIKDLFDNKIVFGFVILFGLLGWIMFMVSLMRFLKLGKTVNADYKLKDALNNELFRLNAYKSGFIGYCTLIATVVIFFGISIFVKISALIAFELTLYIGILSLLIAGLIYNRD